MFCVLALFDAFVLVCLQISSVPIINARAFFVKANLLDLADFFRGFSRLSARSLGWYSHGFMKQAKPGSHFTRYPSIQDLPCRIIL